MHETWAGLYVGLVANLLVAALLNNGPFEPTGTTWLLTLGTANELLGVLLVASPELLPRVQYVGALTFNGLRRVRLRIKRLLRRLLGWDSGVQTRPIGTAVSSEMAMPIESSQGMPSFTTLEERVEWLTKQYHVLTWRLAQTEDQIRRLPAQWQADVAKTRRQLESAQSALEERLANKRIHLRLLGLAYVILGLVLAWLGNVV